MLARYDFFRNLFSRAATAVKSSGFLSPVPAIPLFVHREQLTCLTASYGWDEHRATSANKSHHPPFVIPTEA
jgi:hypothetical protein